MGESGQVSRTLHGPHLQAESKYKYCQKGTSSGLGGHGAHIKLQIRGHYESLVVLHFMADYLQPRYNETL